MGGGDKLEVMSQGETPRVVFIGSCCGSLSLARYITHEHNTVENGFPAGRMREVNNVKHPKIPHEATFTLGLSFKVVKEWMRPDTYPWMKRKAVNYLAPRVAFWISTIALSVHVVWALNTECSVNFQRGGAIVVFAAAALYACIEWHEPNGYLSGGPVQRLSLSNPYFVLPLIGAVGPLVWGYGDLLPLLSNSGCH